MNETPESEGAVAPVVAPDEYVPMQAYRRRAPGDAPLPPEPTVRLRAPTRELPAGLTRAVWGVVAVPFVQGMLNIVIMSQNFSRDALTINAVLFLLVLGAGVGFADRDRQLLAQQGIHGVPSALIALVPIVWLYLRSRVVWREAAVNGRVVAWHIFGIGLYVASFSVVSVLLNLKQAHETAVNLFG